MDLLRILVFIFIITFSVTAQAWWWDKEQEESDPVKPYTVEDPVQQSTEPTRIREGYRFELRTEKDEKLTAEKLKSEAQKTGSEKKEGAIQYKTMEKRDISCDMGALYKNTPEGGLEVTVTAIARGKGSDFRNWKVKDIKINIDGDAIRPDDTQLFYTVKESIFRIPAAVVFAAIGTQYERYSSSCGSGGVCPVTGQSTGGHDQGAISRGIDKAGMAIGLGLLVSQAKGEITGTKCVFKLDKDTADRLNGKNGKIKIVFENPEKHDTETVEMPLPQPGTYRTTTGAGGGADDLELPYTTTTDAPPVPYVVTPGSGGSEGRSGK